MDTVHVRIYNPFETDGGRYLGIMDAEIGFAGRKTTEVPLDQDELAQHFTKVVYPGFRINSTNDCYRASRIKY